MNGRMPRVHRPLAERIAVATVLDPETGCLVWTWRRCKLGYGRVSVCAVNKQAHRVAYELVRGPIPPGLELDHLCKNRACCNPDHLEPVSHAENLRRGDGWSGRNAKKHSCVHGHAFTPENTRIRKSDGARICRTCMDQRWKSYRARLHCDEIQNG